VGDAGTSETLLVEDRGQVRWIWFNRPRVHNAQNVEMLRALEAVLVQTEREGSIRALVLGGKGKSFSAGHDLKEIVVNDEYRNNASTVEGRYWQELRLFVRPVELFANLTVPTICRVQGHCLAASLMFVASADFVVTAEDAVFASRVTQELGAADVEVPAISWLLGERRSKQFLWLGETVSGASAPAMGIANWAVPESELDTRVEAILEVLLRVPREALALSKASHRFMADRQGRQDAAAYHFMAHQISHHTTDAVALLEERIARMQAATQSRTDQMAP
jgi:enoyl-CoA hydratase/carnithine racemase